MGFNQHQSRRLVKELNLGDNEARRSGGRKDSQYHQNEAGDGRTHKPTPCQRKGMVRPSFGNWPVDEIHMHIPAGGEPIPRKDANCQSVICRYPYLDISRGYELAIHWQPQKGSLAVPWPRTDIILAIRS